MEREGDAEGEGHPLLEAVQSCIAAAAGEFDVARQQVSASFVVPIVVYRLSLILSLLLIVVSAIPRIAGCQFLAPLPTPPPTPRPHFPVKTCS